MHLQEQNPAHPYIPIIHNIKCSKRKLMRFFQNKKIVSVFSTVYYMFLKLKKELACQVCSFGFTEIRHVVNKAKLKYSK